MRTVLAVLLMLPFVPGPRFCCFLTSLFQSAPYSVEASQPTPPRKCGCCQRNSEQRPAKPQQPDQSTCPCEQWHSLAMSVLCSTENGKPLHWLLLEGRFDIALAESPLHAHPATVPPAFSSEGLNAPFRSPTEILRLLRICRC